MSSADNPLISFAPDRETLCPWCLRQIIGAIPVDQDGLTPPPSPGCITVCEHCSGVSRYNDLMLLRKPTEAEWEMILQSDAIAQMRRDLLRAGITNGSAQLDAQTFCIRKDQ